MKKILLFTIALLVLITSVFSSGVIIQDLQASSTFKIDCLGEDNLLTIYSVDENKPEGIVSYQGECDLQETLKKQYLDNAFKIVIRNGEDSETLINYVEILNQIEDENANAKIEEFEGKICVSVITSKYSDIEVNNELEQQVKNYYKCFNRDSLNQLQKTSLESKVIIEVLINDKLFKEFIVDLPIEELRISFTDLALIDEKNSQYMNVKFSNPTSQNLKINILGTNLGCPSKSFTMSDSYSMLCNKTNELEPIFYMQVKDDLNRITFKEYQTPPESKKDSKINWFYVLIGIGLVLLFMYNRYKGDVEEKNKSSFDRLDEEDNEK